MMKLTGAFIGLCLLASFVIVVQGENVENTTENEALVVDKEVEEVTDKVENEENGLDYGDKSDENIFNENEDESVVADDQNENPSENVLVESEKHEQVEETQAVENIQPRMRAFAAPVEEVESAVPAKNNEAKTGRYMDYSGYLDNGYNPDNYDWNGKLGALRTFIFLSYRNYALIR
jgi:hypothetical protein